MTISIFIQFSAISLPFLDFMFWKRSWKQNEVELSGEAEMRKAEFLAVGQASKAIF